MKIKSIIATAALLGVMSVSASAITTVAAPAKAAAVSLEKPALTKVVNPTNLPSSFMDKTVTLSFTVDAQGRAHDINVMWQGDSALRRSLVDAVSQWQFTPARKNGQAVATRVTLPVQLTGA
jgi:protein TonB